MSTFRAALAALDLAGVPHCVRNDGHDIDASPAGGDLDILLPAAYLSAADRALTGAGLHRLRAPGHRGHRFYVAYDGLDWRKVDLITSLRYGEERLAVEPLVARRQRVNGVWVVSPADEAGHRARRADGQREPRTLLQRVQRALPAGVRRRGPVVAVLGPDGAGKGSTLSGAATRLPVAVTQVYLGNRRRSTAEAGTAATAAPGAPLPRPSREVVFLLRKALPIYGGIVRAYVASWRGHVVLCDRHPIEVLAIQPPRTRTGAALERLLFAKLVPAPDRIVVLDAPGAVLFARKGEHDPVTLERWRQGYLRVFVPPGAVVQTTGSLEGSVDALLTVLWRATCQRNGWNEELS